MTDAGYGNEPRLATEQPHFGWFSTIPPWLAYCLILGLYLTFRGYHSLDGDQAYRLPLLLNRLDPAVYANDPFVRAFDAFNPHRGYLLILGKVVQPLGLSAGLLAIFLVTFLATCRAINRLTQGVWPESGSLVGWIAVILLLAAKAGNIGTNHLFEAMVLDRLMALALGWWAIADCVCRPDRGWWRCTGALGLATFIHPSLGLQLALVAVGGWIVWGCLPAITAVRWPLALRAAMAAGISVVPGLAVNLGPAGSLLGGLSPDDFWTLAVELQSPQHMLPELWRTPQWLAWGCYLVLATLALGSCRKGGAEAGSTGRAKSRHYPGVRFVQRALNAFPPLQSGDGGGEPGATSHVLFRHCVESGAGSSKALAVIPGLAGLVRRGRPDPAESWIGAFPTPHGIAKSTPSTPPSQGGEKHGPPASQEGERASRAGTATAEIPSAEIEPRTSCPAARIRLLLLLLVVLCWLGSGWVAIERLHDLRITLFQPFRMATLARGLALVLISGRLVQLWNRRHWTCRMRGVLIAVALTGDWMLVAVTLAELAASISWDKIPILPLSINHISARLESCPTGQQIPAALVHAAVLAYGVYFLSRHDTESGHWPILLALLCVLIFSRLARWGPVIQRRFTPRRALALAWAVPALAFAASLIPQSHSLAGTSLVRGLVARCRFTAVPVDDIERLALWCRENTPPTAMFVGPPGPKTFRLWSRRSLAFNRAASPYHAAGLADWFERFQDHVDLNIPASEFVRTYVADRHGFEARYDRLSHGERISLASRQGADHLIAPAPSASGSELHNSTGVLEHLHTEGRYAVYRVNQERLAQSHR
jgi:hypothetical protein